MRVLWFSNTSANADEYFNKELKGTGGWLKSLDKELQRHVELHIAFYHNKRVKPFKYNNTFYYPIVKKQNLLFRGHSIMLSKVVKDEDVLKYLSIIDKVKPDIIHIHGTENPFGYLIDKTKIPIVVSIQGNITVYHNKYFSGIEEKYILKSGLQNYLRFKTIYNRFKKMAINEQYFLNKSKFIIGRTFWDKNITSILAPNARYFHNDEILRDMFYEVEWKEKDDTIFRIFTTNGKALYKGFETLAYSLTLLAEKGINDIIWEVAGISEDDAIVKVAKKKLRKNYPKSKLVLLGKLSESELVTKLLSANLYVMPSHIENSPNNLCEAMIMGIPCIATYAGGTGSLLEDRKEGNLIQDGDPWVLAGAILNMKNDYIKACTYGKNARKKAIIRHDKDIIISQLLKIYEKILTV